MRRIAVLVIVGAIATVLMASAVSHTVFSSLGEPFGGRKWPYILALLISLSISGAGSGIRIMMAPRLNRVAFTLSGVASGALLAFYYGGLAADENPQVAIAWAVVGGLLMGVACLRFQTGVVAVAVASAAAVAGYGLAFWLWAVAIAFWSGQKLLWGLVLSLLSLAYIGLTVSSLSLAIQEIKIKEPLGSGGHRDDRNDRQMDARRLSQDD